MTCLACPSKRSLQLWIAPQPRPGSSPAAHGAGSRVHLRLPIPIEFVSEKLWTPSSPLRGVVSSTRFSRCSTRALYCEPTGPVTAGTPSEVRGARAVAATFSGRARAAQPPLVNGAPGLVWSPGGSARVAFAFPTANGRIVDIELIADRHRVGRLDVSVLDG